MKKKFRHLVIISHPDQKSFCYNGIFKTIIRQMRKHKEIYKVIDLYEDLKPEDSTTDFWSKPKDNKLETKLKKSFIK